MKQVKRARNKMSSGSRSDAARGGDGSATAAARASSSAGRTRLGRPRRLRSWLITSLVVTLALLAAGVGYRSWRAARAPVVPEIVFRGDDPLVEQAIVAGRANVARRPYDAAAWGHFGKVLLAHYYNKDAAAVFAQAQTLDPTEPRWPYFSALSVGDEQYERAIPKLRQCVELLGSSPDPVPRLRLAEALLRSGQLDEAERVLRDVHERDRAHPRALLGLGQVAVTRGQFADARQHLEQAARTAPHARPVFALLAVAYARQGEPELARRAMERSRMLPAAEWQDPWQAELDPVRTGLNAWLDHADSLVNRGATAQALPVLQRATRTYPESTRAWRTYGFALLNAGQPTEAAAALRRATELSPDYPDAHLLLAHALVRQAKPADGEAAARRAAELQPGSGDAHTILGIALHAQSRHAEAAAALDHALRLRPDLADAHLAKADLLLSSGQKNQAIAQLRTAMSRVTDDRAQMIQQRLASLESPGLEAPAAGARSR